MATGAFPSGVTCAIASSFVNGHFVAEVVAESCGVTVGVSYFAHIADLLRAAAFGTGSGGYGAVVVKLFSFLSCCVDCKDVFLSVFGQISVLAAVCEINVDINLFIDRIGDSIGVINLIESVFFSAVSADFVAVILAGSA